MRNNGGSGPRRGSKRDNLIEYDGGRMTRNGLSANHLLNFTLPERERQVLSKKKKKPGPTRTQMEYLHANYRFVIAPLQDDTALACWDIEGLTEWTTVEQVLLWYDETSPVTCPICLDEFRAPKITRCGHIFCWPCILRYLSMTDKYWRRCPMCFDSVQKGQLRSVRLEKVQLPPRLGASVTLQLLQRPKASLFPHMREDLMSSSSATAPRKRIRKLPRVEDPEAKYARILEATNEYRTRLAMQEMRDLEALDAECRSCGDVESLPFVEEAMKATSQRLAACEASSSLAPHDGGGDGNDDERAYDQTLCGLGPSDLYSFYQLDNGSYVILHPLNLKCLTKEYADRHKAELRDAAAAGPQENPVETAWVGDPSQASSGNSEGTTTKARADSATAATNTTTTPYHLLPGTVSGRVVDVEHLVMDDEVQKRYRFLGHLPKFCDFYVCELDLSEQLSPETLNAFRGELKKREKQRRAKHQAAERKPRTPAKGPSSPLYKEFPMSGFSLDDDGAFWPAPAELSIAEAFQELSLQSSSSSTDTTATTVPSTDAMTSPTSRYPHVLDEDASFATITRQSGYFPALGGGVPSSSSAGTATTPMWGAASPPLTFSTPPVGTTTKGGAKKKGKGTQLFSTSQRRSYR